MIIAKPVPCGCWDCRRSRGETPPLITNEAEENNGQITRKGALYAGCSTRETIPHDSDVTGADRPGFNPRRRNRRR